MSRPFQHLAMASAGLAFCVAAWAQAAGQIGAPPAVIPVESEPAPKLVAYPPLAGRWHGALSSSSSELKISGSFRYSARTRLTCRRASATSTSLWMTGMEPGPIPARIPSFWLGSSPARTRSCSSLPIQVTRSLPKKRLRSRFLGKLAPSRTATSAGRGQMK